MNEYLYELLRMLYKLPDSYVDTLRNEQRGLMFDPESSGYDIESAKKSGMEPVIASDGLPHMGSVSPTSLDDVYMLLKGANHPTWNKAIWGEYMRGSKVVKIGDRYYSMPMIESSAEEPAYRTPMIDK